MLSTFPPPLPTGGTHGEKKSALFHQRVSHQPVCQPEFHLPISSGQQFFLLRIYENPGIPLNGLAQMGFFDKGTVSRGVQKLEEAGYIIVITDENDRRCRKLFVTPAAAPIIETLLNAREEWNSALTEGMTDEECLLINKFMKQMAQNAQTYIAKKEEEITCSKEH